MKQASLKINRYARSGVMNGNFERLVLNFTLGSFGALSLAYVIFLGIMVSDIAERRSLEVKARLLSSEVSNLEITYLSMSNDINLDLSYEMGFKEIKANFATRGPVGFASIQGSGESDEALGFNRVTQDGI